MTFSVPNLASALPALFPTEHRYSAIGIAYNLAVAILGGTAPFIIASLIELTGNDMMPTCYLMALVAGVAVAIRFPARISRAAPARVRAERGLGGSGLEAGGEAGQQSAAGPGLAAVRTYVACAVVIYDGGLLVGCQRVAARAPIPQIPQQLERGPLIQTPSWWLHERL